MNKDEVQGKARSMKGTVKRIAGDVSENPDLYDRGVADEAAGEAQETYGRAKRKIGEAVEKVGRAIKK